MKLATWNVNSLKLRLPHVAAWVGAQAPDILCLQELKCDDPQFPQLEIERRGIALSSPGRRRTTAWRSCRARPRRT